MDHAGSRLVFFLTTLFRASGLALLAVPVVRWADWDLLHSDGLLMVALGFLATASLATRRLVRKGVLDASGLGAACALLVIALGLMVCIQRTGGLHSPLFLLLAALVTTGALTLSPLAHFVALAGVCLLHTVMTVATAQGVLPPALGLVGTAEPLAPAPVSLLLIELGSLGLIGFVVNRLACQVREQQAELACRDLRDAETGTLRSALFHARLVALIEDLHAHGEGLAVVLIELRRADASLLREAGAVLLENVRGDDLAGRVAPLRFAVAARAADAEQTRGIARRLVAALRARGPCEPAAGCAHAGAPDLAGDAVEAAAALLAQAEERLAEERVGFAA